MAVALPFIYAAAALTATAASVKSLTAKAPAPPALPELPTAPDAGAGNLDTEKARRAAMSRQRHAAAGGTGRSSTLLTGALGAPGPATTERKSLLGT